MFARAARRYWLNVFPCARTELSVWRRRAERIPDRTLREAALDALTTKSDILEGAIAFASFTPITQRRSVVRAIVAFEIAFDYMDSVLEVPNPDPVANARSLGQALFASLGCGPEHSDYYVHHMCSDDRGYLGALVDACREALRTLPSFPLVVEPACRALSRVVTYQSLNHGDAHGSYAAFTDWAYSQSVPGTNMRWWETGAATGSQLSVLALIAAAADPSMDHDRATAIERAYFPWIGALSTLLDSVVDRHVDSMEGQRNLVDYYASPLEISERFRLMAVQARRALQLLPDADNHLLIIAAMAAFFHSAPQASAPGVGMATRAVVEAMGGQAIPALLFFKARRALGGGDKRI
jgi:tetraprenyl-beta-curcumene synthase